MPDRDPAQMFQQIMQQMTQGAPDAFDFTTKPTTSGDQLLDDDGFFVFNRSDQGPADEGPEETVTFYYGKIADQTFDDLAVDPTDPNTVFDGYSNTDGFAVDPLDPNASAGIAFAYYSYEA